MAYYQVMSCVPALLQRLTPLTNCQCSFVELSPGSLCCVGQLPFFPGSTGNQTCAACMCEICFNHQTILSPQNHFYKLHIPYTQRAAYGATTRVPPTPTWRNVGHTLALKMSPYHLLSNDYYNKSICILWSL